VVVGKNKAKIANSIAVDWNNFKELMIC